MHRQWIRLFSTSMLAIAMAFNQLSYAGAAEKNVFKADLIPVLGSDGQQPQITFGSGTIRIKREGVRVELNVNEISAPGDASGELQLTLKINGNRELVILPFKIASGPGEMGQATSSIGGRYARVSTTGARQLRRTSSSSRPGSRVATAPPQPIPALLINTPTGRSAVNGSIRARNPSEARSTSRERHSTPCRFDSSSASVARCAASSPTSTQFIPRDASSRA